MTPLPGAAPCAAMLALLASVALPASAAAQWPTTQWKVDQVSGPARPGRLAFLEAELSRASAWLEGLGFPAPELIVTGAATGSALYRASYDENLTRPCGNVGALYSGVSRTLVHGKGMFEKIDAQGKVVAVYTASDLADGTVTIDDGYLLAPVHEVFHGVQYGYTSTWPAALDWLTESTAEAVRYAWGAREYGTIQVHQRMSYDLPLHEPFTGAGCTARSEYYRSGHFWYHLGADLGSRDRITYLHDLFDKLRANPDVARHGLGAIDAALAPFSGGLYNLYPQFIARHAPDTSFYRDETIVPLTPAAPVVVDHGPKFTKLRGMAARAWLVQAMVPPNTKAGLTVQLDQDHPDLHLVVDTMRYDVPSPKGQRNVFRTALDGRAKPYEFLVRVVNVAPDPPTSDERPFAIEFRLADVDDCDGTQLWAATHPSARQFLIPPLQYQQRYESFPGSSPVAGTLQIDGLITDGGTSCTHPLTIATNPARPDTAMGGRLQKRLSQMSPQEMMALAQRMSAQSKSGQRPTMEQMAKVLAEDPSIDSLMTKSTMLHVWSPSAVFWQRGAQPQTNAKAMLNAYTQDGPVVPWSHGGVGGWQPNAGGHAVIIIPDVAPEAIREDSTYRAVGAMQYSRGEGVMKTSRRNVSPNSDASWQGLEGWIEQVQSDPSMEPYSMHGMVTVARITGAVIEGTFQLTGMGNYARGECPPNPMNLGSISRQCKADNRNGAVSVSGTFAAPAVRLTTP